MRKLFLILLLLLPFCVCANAVNWYSVTVRYKSYEIYKKNGKEILNTKKDAQTYSVVYDIEANSVIGAKQVARTRFKKEYEANNGKVANNYATIPQKYLFDPNTYITATLYRICEYYDSSAKVIKRNVDNW